MSADLVKYVLETEKIDTIIHAAAQTHVDNSFGNSFAFTENNVMGTHVLIETAKTHGVTRFIHVLPTRSMARRTRRTRGALRRMRWSRLIRMLLPRLPPRTLSNLTTTLSR